MDNSLIQFTLHLTDAAMNDDERDTATRRLLQQLKSMDEVEMARLVADPVYSPQHKAIVSTLIGLLNVTATVKNAMKVLEFIADRWGDKPIELEIEMNDRKLKIVASSRAELEMAVKAAQDFIVPQENNHAETGSVDRS